MDELDKAAWDEANRRFPEHSRWDRKKIVAVLRRRNFLRDTHQGSRSLVEANAIDWLVGQLEDHEYEPVT